ncbi:DNA glycosylase AlkZ-like family protein [Umezawaea tangerina]|uniref:Winged helix DNA-binding protein n=1 Tax=Umezawaea tangerina TaxID=84725 RepID=A0A2T0S5I8_9PSEU|nr:crosslink repair DNA glycosylase YcaQ family protein [Umezawaea tangerina]PRY28672.1 winged helix DNA-binding protein [Umezawaea tangerina]
MEATRAQVLAHRAAVQGLHGGVALDDVEALALGFVDSPPKTGGVGIAVRTGPVDLDGLVRVLSLRGAPHLHRRADLPVLRRELRPRTPRQFAAWVGGFDPPDLGHLDLLIELLRREFPGDRATKGELSAAVSPLLPADWTPWCEPCGADHVVDGLFRLGTLLAGLELEHVGARLVFRKPTGPLPVVEDAGEPTLLRAYARLVGPFAKADAEKWLGAGPRAAWPQELRPVTVDGRGLLVSEDVGEAPPPPAALLLFHRDPYLLGPRWLVAPDAAVAKRVWRPVGSPGALVVHGEVVGDWRYSFSGRTVTFAVRGWSRIRGAARKALGEQAELLAAVWGASALEPNVVEWAQP